MARPDSLFRASVVTVFANIANRGLGFIREASLARLFGTGILLDRFVVAFSVPEYLTFIVFASLPVALLPTRREVGEDSARIASFFWSGLLWITVIYGLLTLAIFFGATIIAQTFGMASDSQTTSLTQLLSPYILLGALEAYFRGWLYDARSFTIPALSSFALNGIFIAGLVLMPQADPTKLAQLYLLSSLVLVIINGVGAVHVIRPFPAAIGTAHMRSLFLRQWHIGLVEGLALIYPIIDRFVAARFLGEGDVAALRYAYVLVMLPSSVLAYTASISSYPWVTAKSTPERVAELRALYHSGVRLIFLLVALASAGLYIFADDCVAIAFQRGAFDAASLARTAQPIRWFALGLPCYAIVLYQMRFFYARTAIRLLFGSLLLMSLVKIGGSLALAPLLGTSGLALTTSGVWLLTVIILGTTINRWIGSNWRELLVPEFPKLLAVTIVVAGIWQLGKIFWPATNPVLLARAIRLGVLGLVGLGIAVGLVQALHIVDGKRLAQKIKSALQSRK